MSEKPIQMTILGGFLGSGKTTILNTIIRNLPENQKTAILINDFGDVNIDSRLIQKGEYSKKEIKGGCICCSLREKLLQNLLSIVNEEKPDHVYIEATGLAVPWEMKKSIDSNFSPERLLAGEVLVCVDAKQCDKYHDYLPAYSRQFEGQPFVLMTKADLYDSDLLKLTEKKLRRHYPGISGFSESYNGKWSGNDMSVLKEDKRPKAMMPFLLQPKLIDTGKDGIEELSFQGALKGNPEELKSLINENNERIIRLKALIPIQNNWKSIQYDGEFLSESNCTIKDSTSPRQTVLTLFCMKDQKAELKRLFTEIIQN